MRRLFASLFTLAFLTASPAFAVMEDYPSVKLQGLDKSVGRTVTFEAKVGSTIQYGPLYIKIQACRKAPPIEKPESAAFLQIWQVPPGGDKSEWVFSGWMFASSPALSAMDHPVYDVWVLDCLGKEQPNEEAEKAQTDQQADQTTLAPADAVKPDTNGTTAPPAGTPNTDQTPAMSPTEAPAVDINNIPTDSEAEDDDTSEDAPAAPETPAPDTSVPNPQDRPAPIVPGEQTWQPQSDPQVQQQTDPQTGYPPQTQTQPAPTPPVAADDPNVTAYDFMNQNRGTNAGPSKAPQPQPYQPPAPQY